jgi:hypothetical protein
MHIAELFAASSKASTHSGILVTNSQLARILLVRDCPGAKGRNLDPNGLSWAPFQSVLELQSQENQGVAPPTNVVAWDTKPVTANVINTQLC